MSTREQDPLLLSSGRQSADSALDMNDNQSVQSINSESPDEVVVGLRKNLYTTASSIFAQVGAITFFLYIFYHIMRHDIIFFTGHPALNNFGFLLLAQSIILVQPTSTAAEKALGATVHGIFNIIGAASFFGSFGIIFLNKAAHNGVHFASPHAVFGLITYMILMCNVLLGITQFWMPHIYGSPTRAKSLYKYHRVIGYVALVFGYLTVCLATITDYNRNVLSLRFPVILGLVLITSLGLAVRIRPQKFQFKSRRS
ncbi:hypothetical protein V1512DRAFT_263259 [Lipomyces arxii]|uniref:uncharacterized protein n=1 Tax=Lipomyces arxii TaxID=56418 RepID=UPI0034CD22D6